MAHGSGRVSKNAAVKPLLIFVWGKIIRLVEHCIALNAYSSVFLNLLMSGRHPEHRGAEKRSQEQTEHVLPITGRRPQKGAFPSRPGLGARLGRLWCLPSLVRSSTPVCGTASSHRDSWLAELLMFMKLLGALVFCPGNSFYHQQDFAAVRWGCCHCCTLPLPHAAWGVQLPHPAPAIPCLHTLLQGNKSSENCSEHLLLLLLLSAIKSILFPSQE